MDEDGNRSQLERGPAGPVIALFCLVVGFVVGAMGYGLFSWELETLAQRVVRMIVVECFATLTLFAFLAFIWSLFAPRWIERLIRFLYGKLVFAIGALLLVGICLFLYS